MIKALSLMALVSAASAISLSSDNFDAETAGKTAFIKFYAPWCGHCKALKPAWDTLMEEFKDSKTVVIGDVDCTVAKDLCAQYAVKGYPTLKHGDVNNMEDYQGGRGLDDIRKFAKENLGPRCGPAKLELCDDAQKKEIEIAMAMTDDKIDAKIAEFNIKLTDAESTFKSEVEKLQTSYEKLLKEKDDTIAAVKKGGLGVLKSVKAQRAR